MFKANELYDMVLQNIPEKNAKWKKKDANLQKLIVTTLNKKLLLHVLDCKIAHEMRIKICIVYERDSEHLRCNLLLKCYSTYMIKE